MSIREDKSVWDCKVCFPYTSNKGLCIRHERDALRERAEKAEELNSWYSKRCSWYAARIERLEAVARKARLRLDELQRTGLGYEWHDREKHEAIAADLAAIDEALKP